MKANITLTAMLETAVQKKLDSPADTFMTARIRPVPRQDATMDIEVQQEAAGKCNL